MHLFSDGEKIYMCVKYKAQLEFICDVNGWLGDWLMGVYACSQWHTYVFIRIIIK